MHRFIVLYKFSIAIDAENNEKLDKLISLLEEMHIRNRENNAILYQMIFTLGLFNYNSNSDFSNLYTLLA